MSVKKKTLTERLGEAEKRAASAEFDLKLSRGREERLCAQFGKLTSAFENERERSRTLQFMVNNAPSARLVDHYTHEVHTLRSIVSNLINWPESIPGKPLFVACPKCGRVSAIPDNSQSHKPGYRLCDKCLADLPDPWKEKPGEWKPKEEYALATKE
ncbi:MAG: hypothetical protein PHX83_06755 [Acidobacteriia bacterium]|nr:hypothetical protein [Terriglobia bacterium]